MYRRKYRCLISTSDVNKATTYKAKDLGGKAKAKNFGLKAKGKAKRRNITD